MTETEHHQAVIVGGGFAGLAVAIELQKAGINDFIILERAAEPGGTWRDNDYPGCACDVPSVLYAYSFAPNPDWTRRYASQAEIQRYFRSCVTRFQLASHFRCGAMMIGARYDAATASWQVRTLDGRAFAATVLIAATGGLSNPALPDIPGLERFAGPSFHSARWDHGVSLAGRRVAIIGTGASAIQIVPQLARMAAQVDLYQRRAAWVLPRNDRAVPKWLRAVYRRLPVLQRLARGSVYLQFEARALGMTRWPALMRLAAAMAQRHLRRQVADPSLRARLTPDYGIGCKRILIADDYYPALAGDRVALHAGGVCEITERGVVGIDGIEREADVLVLATGFRVQAPPRRGVLIGRDGLDLADAWRPAARAYLGTVVAGFPNFFMMTGPNTGLGHSSMLLMIEAQARYVAKALRTMQANKLISIEVRAEVLAAYDAELQARLGRTIWRADCGSWYVNANGRNTTLWPGFTFEFRRRLRRFRISDYHLAPAAL